MERLRMSAGLCPPPQAPVTERPLFAGRAISALVPILVTLLLPLIALASPPDSSWIAGIYDGANGDDVVMTVNDTVATDGGRPSPIPQRPCQAELLFERSSRGVPNVYLARGPRAPPAGWPMASSRVFGFLSDSLPPPLAAKAAFPPWQVFPCRRTHPHARAVVEVDNFMATRTEESLDVVAIFEEWQ